ncbi:MAG: DUF2807 domain-containing protein [Bacteroidales bacterium]|nr:DUF2807 domain-containing protein [Bacteroidales bacterium]
MKTQRLILFCFMCAFLGCSSSLAQESKKMEKFTKMSMSRGVDVYFTQGDSYSLRIEGDSRHVENITTKVHNGLLEISRDKNFHFEKGSKVKVYVSAPSLEKVLVNSGSDFQCEKLKVNDSFSLTVSSGADAHIGQLVVPVKTIVSANSGADCKISKLETGQCELSASGGADMEVTFAASEIVYAEATGGSDMKLRGQVKDIKVKAFGGSDIDLRHLKQENIDIRKSGGSDIHP